MSDKPEFKPGNTVALQFGKELLNGNVNWRNTLTDILRYSNYSIMEIAEVLEASADAVQALTNDDPRGLSFKQGARLLSMREILKPTGLLE